MSFILSVSLVVVIVLVLTGIAGVLINRAAD